MTLRPRVPCNTPGCPTRVVRGRCTACRYRRGAIDDTSAPYTPAVHRKMQRFLLANSECVLCGRLAEIADHYPRARKLLVRLGVNDPDAPEHLRPLCCACHNKQTALRQPGQWWKR